MANRVWLTPGYIIPRWSVWTFLLVIALLDGIFHRAVRSRGWQLYGLLTLTTFLYVLRETFLFAWVLVGSSSHHWLSTSTLGSFIFFSDAADAALIAVLIAIAAGFCITRPDLGPHRTVVFVIPSIFFGTSLVVDYVLFALRGRAAFSDDASDDAVICVGEDGGAISGAAETGLPSTTGLDADPTTGLECDQEVSPLTGLIFFVCILANMLAFMMAWFYIFDTAQKERDLLEDVAAELPMGEAVEGNLPGSSSSRGGALTGHAQAGTASSEYALGPRAGPGDQLYASTRAAEPDVPKTVQDRVELREKLRLIRAFFMGVSIYVLATLAVLFLPIFVPRTVDRVVLAVQNGLLWLLLAALLVTFRMRQGNNYLVLAEVGPDTSTELGVLAHGPDSAAGDPEANAQWAAAANAPLSPWLAHGPGGGDAAGLTAPQTHPSSAAPPQPPSFARRPAPSQPASRAGSQPAPHPSPPPSRHGPRPSLGARRVSAPSQAERDAALDAAFSLDDDDDDDQLRHPSPAAADEERAALTGGVTRSGSSSHRVNRSAAKAGVILSDVPPSPRGSAI